MKHLMKSWALCLVLAAASHAGASTIDWIDFTGWDQSLVTGAGQTFLDVCPDIDLTVMGEVGAFGSWIEDGGITIQNGTNTETINYTFTFSAPIDVVLAVKSLDGEEKLTISTDGTATYMHSDGALPTITGSLMLQGNGYGFSATGAARGLVSLDNITQFNWTYQSFANKKYEAIMIGKVVPEPAGIALISSALAALMVFRRR